MPLPLRQKKKDKALNTVLLIEDDLEILKLNEKYLTSKNYSVCTADCGEAALKVLQKTVPDCIVLDIMLPDILGFELCEKIRQICNTPIIFLSCKDTENDKVQGLLSGGDDYMTKPFSMRELEARISAQLRRTAIIQEQETEVLKKIKDQHNALRIMKHDYKYHLNAALGMIRRGEHEKGEEYLALENAVEACQKLKAGGQKRRIELVIKQKGKQLAIMARNTFDGNAIMDGEQLVSTKKDGGIGLQSIRAEFY